MNPALKIWVIKPLMIIIIALVVAAGVTFAVISTQQQRLVNLAVEELNAQFKGELTIGESHISLFKNFPYVSIVLHDGRFLADKTKKGKPIYEFDRLYVGFRLTDLLHQNYNVKVLFLKGGHLDLVQQQNGIINLVEAKTPQQDGTAAGVDRGETTTGVSVNLDKVVLSDMDITFLDNVSGRKFSSRIDKLTSSFKIDSTLVAVVLEGQMELDVMIESDTLFLNKPFQLDLKADYNTYSRLFEISDCNFKLEKAGFNATGYASLLDTTDVNFKVKGDKQDFSLFTAFLPASVKENLKPFQYDGRLDFNAIIKGKVTEEHLPLIEISFACEDAWFLNTEENRKVDQLGFKGYYTNGPEHSLQTSEIHIINVSARPEKGIFKGNFVVRDFTKPRTLLQLKSELELKFLGEFLGIHDLKQITGKIKLDMDFKEIHDITLPEESLNKLKEGIQSNLSVENLSFRIPGYPHPVRDMNIHAEMIDGRVTVDSAVLKIGKSDLRLSGSISDVRAFLRGRDDKTIHLVLNAGSDQMVLSELLSYDTILAKKWKEEVHGFNISMMLETSVHQLLHPDPLPKGKFEIKNLRGAFKEYGHTFKNLGATVMINDTLLRLRDFTGMIDSSDINFKGRIVNYHLWFDEIKKGRTQIAFDFKSNRFALKDVFSREIRKNLPRGYRREELYNVWLRMKFDLKYDTIFRFAKGRVSNITAELKKHKLKLTEISGGVKYGSKILSFDTLRGKVGNSDFDISLKYYFKGIDRYNKKVDNSLTFNSKFLDIDEMSLYDLAPKKGRSRRDTTRVAVVVDSSQHSQAFNIFIIPFSNFNAQINIGKVKYNRLWLKDVNAQITMKEDQTIRIDTLMLRVAGGSVNMRGKFNGSNKEKIYFRSRINFDQVDLEKMLLKLDHFGQDIVINKNIKGRISGQIKSYVQVHPDLVPVMSNTKAEMTLNIYNGSLVDFAPMQAMASYFKDKNLRLIRFDTLQNKLTFTNGVLDIPTMNINSSLGYIQMSGKQSLDLQMEYYVRVPMKLVTKAGISSLFNGKPDEVNMDQVDEIEYIGNDRKIAFMNLRVTGTPDDFKVTLGRDKVRKL